MKKNFVKYEFYTNSNGDKNNVNFDYNDSDEDIIHEEFFKTEGTKSTKNIRNYDDKLNQLFEKMIKKESSKKNEIKDNLKNQSDDSYNSDDLNIEKYFKNKKHDDKGKNNVYQKEKIKIKVEEKVEEEEEESDDDIDKFFNQKIDSNDYISDDFEEKEDTPKNFQIRTIKNSLMNLYSDKKIDDKNNIKENENKIKILEKENKDLNIKNLELNEKIKKELEKMMMMK